MSSQNRVTIGTGAASSLCVTSALSASQRYCAPEPNSMPRRRERSDYAEEIPSCTNTVTILSLAIILIMGTGTVGPGDGKSPKSYVVTSSCTGLVDSNSLECMNREDNRETLLIEENVWGGQHVRLVIKANSAEVEFDCAHGEITEPFKTDATGRFDLAGTFTREGGPTRSDESGEPARYSGKVTGERMTLFVTLTDSNQKLDLLSLTRGHPGQLRKCK